LEGWKNLKIGPSHLGNAKQVMTVLGPINPTDLGITLIHEHLIIDMTCWLVPEPGEPHETNVATSPVSIEILGRLRREPMINKDNLVLSDVRAVAEELREFRNMGGRTVVESSTIGLGRDPIALRKISTLTGVNVVAGTGYYVEQSCPPGVKNMSIEDLADVMIRDITVGIGNTNIRAGIIGEIGVTEPMTKQEMNVLRAAGMAHMRTGAPITIHHCAPSPSSREGMDALCILKDEGVRLGRVTMSHSDEKDLDLEKEYLKTGAFINFDHFGLEFYRDAAGSRFLCDTERVDKITRLVKDGYASQIMLSHDVCMKMQLRRYGGFGYDHILRSIVPMLRMTGVDAGMIRQMLELNPSRFLPF
jgi:phosphotriesterase-related protein